MAVEKLIRIWLDCCWAWSPSITLVLACQGEGDREKQEEGFEVEPDEENSRDERELLYCQIPKIPDRR
jgi:hypothetical protein